MTYSDAIIARRYISDLVSVFGVVKSHTTLMTNQFNDVPLYIWWIPEDDKC